MGTISKKVKAGTSRRSHTTTSQLIPIFINVMQGMSRGEERKMKLGGKTAASSETAGVQYPTNRYLNNTCLLQVGYKKSIKIVQTP